jgi:hypothetical protein
VVPAPVGLLRLEHHGDGKCGVRAKPHCDGYKKADQAEIKPEDGNECACCICKESNGISRHRPHDAAEPLRCEVERHPQAIEAANWPDNSKIRRANADDLIIPGEKLHP